MTIDERIASARRQALQALNAPLEAMNGVFAFQAFLPGVSDDDLRPIAAQPDAFHDWYPGASAADCQTVFDRIRAARDALVEIPIRYVPHASGAPGPDRLHWGAIQKGAPARVVAENENQQLLPRDKWYIALYPEWLARPEYAVTRLIHESFHLSDPRNFRHPSQSKFFDSWAYQGFVSDISGTDYDRAVVRKGAGL